MLTIAVQPITWSFSPYSFSLNALKRANISTFRRFYSYSAIKYTIPVLQVFIKILNKKQAILMLVYISADGTFLARICI